MRILTDTNLTRFSEETIREELSLFPSIQADYVTAMHHLQGRRERMAAYLLLVEALKQENAFQEMPLIGHGEHGKPYLTNYPHWHFNQSHCKEGVAIVVSKQGPVGIDIECRRKINAPLIKRVCNEHELEMIATAKDSELEFLRIWTRKEAYVKYLGTGIQDNLKEVEPQAIDLGLTIESRPLCSPIEGWLSVCYK